MAIRDLVPVWNRKRNLVPQAHRLETDVFSRFQQEMNRLFDDFFTAVDTPFRQDAMQAFAPRVDVADDRHRIAIHCE